MVLWMPGDEKRHRDIALEIMRDNIARDPVGMKLTPEAQKRAAQHAVDNCLANMGNGDAAKIGIAHVTDGILKK